MVMGHTNADSNIREYKITDIDISDDNQNIDISAMFIYIYILLWYPVGWAAPWDSRLTLQQCFGQSNIALEPRVKGTN